MDETVQYGHMRFAPDFLSGVNDGGETIRFTRAERTLLGALVNNAGVVLSRDRLLDALAGIGSETRDRSIDFIINRLRRKLADSARHPIYIESQYGEGYRWIAPPVKAPPPSAGAFMVVGPLHGLKYLDAFVDDARTFAEALCEALDRKTAKGRRVVIDADCPALQDFVGERPQFAVELSFLSDHGRLDCAVTVRAFATGQVLHLSRLTIATMDEADHRTVHTPVAGLADRIATMIWDAQAMQGNVMQAPSDPPLAVRMHNASRLFTDRAFGEWAETDRRARALLEKNPDDPEAQLMVATSIHSKYVSGGGPILPEPDLRRQDEDDIERLILASLPRLQDNPVFVLAAAKLLYFVDRGHRPLARDLAERAFKATTALATSFAIYGQMRMHEGELEEAARLFDQGVELSRSSEGPTEFELYLLVLKTHAVLASGDRKWLAEVVGAFYARAPAARAYVDVYYVSGVEEEIPPGVSQLLDTIDAARARRMLGWVDYTCARLFAAEEHRQNVLKGPLTLFARHFGPQVITDEIRAEVPRLVAALS